MLIHIMVVFIFTVVLMAMSRLMFSIDIVEEGHRMRMLPFEVMRGSESPLQSHRAPKVGQQYK